MGNIVGTLIGGIIAIDLMHHVIEKNRKKKKKKKNNNHHIFDGLWD